MFDAKNNSNHALLQKP